MDYDQCVPSNFSLQMGYENACQDAKDSASAASSASRAGSAPTSELASGSPGRSPFPWIASLSPALSFLSLILRVSIDFLAMIGLQIGAFNGTQKRPHIKKPFGHSWTQMIPAAKSESTIGNGVYFSAHIKSSVVRP